MDVTLTKKEIEILHDLIKAEMQETKDLINNVADVDKDKLSDYYNKLYMLAAKFITSNVSL